MQVPQNVNSTNQVIIVLEYLFSINTIIVLKLYIIVTSPHRELRSPNLNKILLKPKS